ncbi:HTH-type transcriptional repressor PurR [Streptomyces alboniger]
MTRRLAQVAKKVGVSEATVSRVLNDKPGVSATTRQSAPTALDVLGYERPTQLRGERARLVGLVLPELQNPIFPAFAEVIGGALAQQGLTPVLCTQTRGGVSEADYVDLLLQQHVSGVIFAGGLFAEADAPHDHYRRLAERNIPVVLINAPIDGLDFPCVACDDAVAVEQAWRHLASLGHERIGLVLGPSDHVPSRRKLEAAREVARAAGAELPEEHVERSIFSLEGGQAAASRLPAARRHRHRVRKRPARPGRDQGGPSAGPFRTRRRVRGRLRRLRLHDLHGAAALDGATAHRGDGPRGGRPALRPDQGHPDAPR